jgi:soluble lytic murein transglycosylase-like protein
LPTFDRTLAQAREWDGRCRARWRARLWRIVGLVLALAGAGSAIAAPIPAQQDPALRGVVQQAIVEAQCFTDQYDSAVWYTLMEPKLRRYVKDNGERLEILRAVYCETHRSEETVLPAGLVLAVLDVESRFDRWAVSSAGAVGLMQVMPFWPEQLGMRRYELTRTAANVRMGCAILRYYLQNEQRDVRRALERYNGSVGHRDYPDRVIVRWTTYWNGADDLGRAPLKRS